MGQLRKINNNTSGRLRKISDNTQNSNINFVPTGNPTLKQSGNLSQGGGSLLYSESGSGSLFKKKKDNISTLDSVLTTIGDAALESTQATLGLVENLVSDPLTRLTGAVVGIFNKDLSKQIKDYADNDIVGSMFGKSDDLNIGLISKESRKMIDEYSLLGDVGDAVSQGVGTSLGLGAAGSVISGVESGVIGSAATSKGVQAANTFATSGISSYNSKLSEMHKAGYDEHNSQIAALKEGIFEGITENIGAGIPGLNTSGAFEGLETSLGNAITKSLNKTAGKIAVNVLKAGEESSEEFFNNLFNEVSDRILYQIDKNYTYGKDEKSDSLIKDIFNEKTLEAMVSAGISSALTMGGSNVFDKVSTNKAIKSYAKDNNISFKEARDTINKYKQTISENLQRNGEESIVEANEQASAIALRSAKDGSIAYNENRLKNLLKVTNDTEENIRKDLVSGRYDRYTFKKGTNANENALEMSFRDAGADNSQRTKDLVDLGKSIQNATKNKVQVRATNREQLLQNNNVLNSINKDIRKSQQELIKEEQQEINRINNEYEAQLNSIDSTGMLDETLEASIRLEQQEKIQNVRQEYTRRLSEVKDKIQNEFLNNLNGFMTKDENGNAVLVVNYDSTNTESGKFIIGHELTHTLENVEGYEEYKKLINEYYQKNNSEEYNNHKKQLEKLYANNKGNIEAEMTADLTGKMFSDEKFLTNMLNTKANMFTNIYSKVKELYYKATGQQEKAQLEEIMRNFRNVYAKVKNADIDKEVKLSLSEDNQGRELTKEQQEFFKDSKIRDDEGRLLEVYHGSQKAGFTTFNRNYNYYTNNENVAQTYSGSKEMVDTRKLESLSDAKSWLKGITDELYIENNNVYDYDGEKILEYNNADELLKNLKRDIQVEIGNPNAGGNYVGYLNISNPLVVNANGDKWSGININGIEIENAKEFLEKYGSSTFRENGAIRTSTNDIVAAVSDAIDDGEFDYDGIIFKDIRDEGGFSNNQKNAIIANDYITFNSNQFKAVDNLNPTNDPDIRYSLSPKGEIVDNNGNKANFKTSDNQNNNLMVMQGLSTDNLKNILSLGGIPVPSLGITDAKYSDVFNEFGGQNGVVLLFSKDTIDPKIKSNEVYSRDIYSKTIPEIYEKVDKKLLNQKLNEFSRYESEYGSFNKHDYSKSSLNSIVNDMLYADAAKAKFLDDNNYQYEKVYRKYKSQYGFTEEVIDKFLNEHPDLASFNPYSVDNTNEITELAPRIKDIALDMMAESDPKITRKQLETLFNDKWYLNDVINFYRDIKGYQRLNGQKEFDSYATRDNINNVVEEHKEEYEKWLRDKFKDAYGDKYFENDRGTKKDYTLENLTSYMKKGNTKAQQKGMFDTYGIGQAKGDSAKRYMSIEQIKLASEKLVDAETYKARHDAFEKIDEDVRTDIGDTRISNGGDVFEVYSDYYMALGQTARGIDAETALRNNYFNNLSDEQIQKFKEVADALNNLPAKYFEAKPQRTVTLDEIKGIVVPNNIDTELRQQLLNNGYNLAEFDPSIEGDKTRVINQFENLKFSMSEEQETTPNEDAIRNQIVKEMPELPFVEDTDKGIKNNNITPYTNSKGGILSDEDIKTRANELINEKINRNTLRTNERALEEAKISLNLDKQKVDEFNNSLNQYRGMTSEQLSQSKARDDIYDFVQKNSTMTYKENFEDETLKKAKNELRKTKIKITDELKNSITDYNEFKKSVFGKLTLSNEGQGVDSVYNEFKEMYPSYFEELNTEEDMLYKLKDFMESSTNTLNEETYELTPNEIKSFADRIYYALQRGRLSESELNKYVSEINSKMENVYNRRLAINKYREDAKQYTKNLDLIKDKKMGILYQINTAKRNIRDIMPKDMAEEWYNHYIKPVSDNNAKANITHQYYNDRIAKYNLNDEESTYVQMIGEKGHNPQTTLTDSQIIDFYNKNQSKIDKAKCEKAVEEFRSIYDELYNSINQVLRANGYKGLEYRKGYFPHFIEEKSTSFLGKLAEKMGWKKPSGALPTDIAGITEEFKPGKAWTSFAQQRTGDATDYNALKGFDNYLNGAMDVIFHTEDIQKLRALENEIRYQYSDKGVKEKIDSIMNDDSLDIEEKYEQIQSTLSNVRNNPLGNLVSEIREYTNNLANKKSFTDRSMEQLFGRNTYSISKQIMSRVSANMVGANVSSAMTNFIPITQAWGGMSTKNLFKGIQSTIQATFKDDGFSNNSVWLTNRTKQADRLYKSKLDKINEKLGIPFEAVDSFTSNVIVRGKYLDNIEKGMSEQEAISNADEFAKDVMAGRSKGETPTAFNKTNPLLKMFTAFQLEVNNQYGYMFKDLPASAGEAKDKLAAALLKVFLGAFLYNWLSEKITGRKSAFSPIDTAIDNIETVTNENLDFGQKLQAITKDVSQELPFVSGIVGGGRLPISSAIPFANRSEYQDSALELMVEAFGEDEAKKAKAQKELLKEFSKPIYFLALPFAGGQIKKTIEGAEMYSHELPGSYTTSGNLRFEAPQDALGKAQALVFGQYASENAREYFDKGYSALTPKQVQEAQNADLSINEYREYQKGIKGKTKISEQVDYINSLPYSEEQKESLIKDKTKKDIDVSNYNNYDSYDEFNYAMNNPTKYDIIKQIVDYRTYNTYNDDIKKIKANSNNAKKEVVNYIEKLNLNKYQKTMLYRISGGYSIKNYKDEMYNYINSLNITANEKKNIWKELYGG